MKVLGLVVLGTSATLAAATCDRQICIDIDFPKQGATTAAPAPVRVDDNAAVTLRLLNVSPIHACSIEKKEQDLPVPDAIAGILGMLNPAAGLLVLSRPPSLPPFQVDFLAKSPFKPLVESAEASQETTIKQIEAKSNYLEFLSALTRAFAALPQAEMADAKKRLLADLAALDRPGEPDQVLPTKFPKPEQACLDGSFSACQSELDAALAQEGKAVIGDRLPQAEMAAAAVAAIRTMLPSKLDDAQQIQPTLDRLASNNRMIGDAITRLADRLKALRETRAIVKNLRDDWIIEYAFRSGRNLRVNGTVSCKNLFTGGVSLEPVPYSITFQSIPRISFSAGFMMSTVPRRTFTVTQSAPGGTFRAAEDVTSLQSLLFTGATIRIGQPWTAMRREWFFGITPGLASNPVNKELGYSIGPTLSAGPAQFFAGWHRAQSHRAQPGFIGATSAASFTVPLLREWRNGFSLGLLYRIPLK